MKRRALAMVAGGLVLATAAGVWLSVRDSRAKAFLEEVPRLTAESGSSAAIAKILEAQGRFEKQGGDLKILGELGRLYLANGRDEEAEKVLKLLCRVEPGEPLWPHLLAYLLSGYGRLAEAIPVQQRSVELAPAYVPGRLRWAEALAKGDDRSKAKLVYEGVLAAEPRNVYALLGLARLALERKDWAAAESFLLKANAADAKFSASHALLSTVYEKMGRPAEAVQESRRATVLGRFRDFDDPWVDGLESYCYDPYRLRVAASKQAGSGRLTVAAELLERAFALDETNAKLSREIGVNYLALKNYDKAAEWFRKSIALAPREAAAYIDLIGIYKMKGDKEGGLELLQRGLEACPNSAGLHFEYAKVLHALGRISDETEHLEAAVRLEPHNLSSYFELASQYFRSGREPDGLRTLEAAYSREPDNVTALSMLARYHIMYFEKEKAQKFIKESEVAGLDPTALRDLKANFKRRFFEEP